MRYGIYRSVDGGPWAPWTTARDEERFERLCREEGGPLEDLFIAYNLDHMETVDRDGVTTLYQIRSTT